MDTIIRGVMIYVSLLLIVRLSGRRTMSEMTAFDLVLTLVIAETTQQALLGDDFSITNAVLLIVTLFTLDVGLSLVKRSSVVARKWLDGTPTLLVVRGKPDWTALKRARLDIDDVMAAARMSHGLERLEQVKYAILEGTGEVSIIPAS